MASFSLRVDLAIQVNRHFLENEYGDLSFFSVAYVDKYGPILSVEQETMVGNVNLASNCGYNHGATIRICMV